MEEELKLIRRVTLVLEQFEGDDGWWCVSSPEIPSLHTEGRTLESAIGMAASAIRDLKAAGVDALANTGVGAKS